MQADSAANLAERVRLLEAELRRVFFAALPDMDYEVGGGTWDKPRWAWTGHPWLELLGITEDECIQFLRGGKAVRQQIAEMGRAS